MSIEFIQERLRTSANATVSSYAVAGVIGAIVAVIYWAIINAVSASAPQPTPVFDTLALVTDAEHPAGAVIGQIPWSPRFTDLRVMIVNTSATDWFDLDFTLRPDEPVAAVGQVTSLTDVAFTSAADGWLRMEATSGSTGKRTIIPLRLIASTDGYRVQCRKLSDKGRLEIMLAIAGIPEFKKKPPQPPRSDFGVLDRDYVIRYEMADYSHWYGHGSDAKGRIEEVFSEKRPVPRTIQIDGRFFVSQREQVISQRLDVRDVFREGIPEILKQVKPGK